MILAASILVSGGKKSGMRPFAAALIVAPAVLNSPKITILGGQWFLVEIAWAWRDGRQTGLRASLAIGAGGGAAAAVAFAVLLSRRISPRLVYDLVIRFHAAFIRVAHFDGSLAGALRAEPALLTLVALGFICWVFALATRRLAPVPLEITILLFLVIELATVPMPYKQYFAPWFVLATVFIPSCFYVFHDLGHATVDLACAVLLIWTIHTSSESLEFFGRLRGLQWRRAYAAYLDRAGVAGKSVLVPVPAHPIDAFDASWYWVRSIDPHGQNDTETVMASLGGPLAARFSLATYLRELERAHPYMLMDIDLSPRQTEAVHEYLARHSAEYERRAATGAHTWFRRAG